MRRVVGPLAANVDLKLRPAAAVGVRHQVGGEFVDARFLDQEMRGADLLEVRCFAVEVCVVQFKLIHNTQKAAAAWRGWQ